MRKRFLLWLPLLGCFATPTNIAAADDAGALLTIGVAQVDITPGGPIRLSGYGSRKKESEGVAGRLKAGALAFGGDDEEGGPHLLITAELIGMPAFVVDAVAKRLREKAGIERSHLTVCATHTHTGPSLAGFLNETHFGAFLPPDQMARLRAYTDQLIDHLERVALDALAARKPARLSWTQGEVGFAMNRRRIVGGKCVGMAPTPEGPVDHALPVLVVAAPDGRVRAVLANYACHCTTYGGKFNRIHGDWAGAAARQIEARHSGAVALISIGCGGDANPEPRGAASGSEWVDAHGKAVADEVDRLLGGGRVALNALPVSRLREIELALDHVPGREELQARLKGSQRRGFYARLLLDRMDKGEKLPASFRYPVQIWTFGDDLAMVFLAGEVVVDYSLRLKRELVGDKLWVTAYANDAPGYIASKRLIGEGGYEVDASMDNYDKPARLSSDVEDRIIATVKELLPAAFQR